MTKPKKTAAQRQRKWRKNMRKKGFFETKVWIKPAWKEQIKAFVKSLKTPR